MPHSKFLPFILTILPELRLISDWARTLLSSFLQMGHSIQVGATPLSWSQALPSPSSDYLGLHDLPYLLWTILDSAILCTSSGLSQTPQSSMLQSVLRANSAEAPSKDYIPNTSTWYNESDQLGASHKALTMVLEWCVRMRLMVVKIHQQNSTFCFGCFWPLLALTKQLWWDLALGIQLCLLQLSSPQLWPLSNFGHDGGYSFQLCTLV